MEENSNESIAVILLMREEREQLLESIEKYLAGEFKTLQEELVEEHEEGKAPIEIMPVDDESDVDDLFDDEGRGKCFVVYSTTILSNESIKNIRQRLAAVRDEYSYAVLMLTREEADQLSGILAILLSDYVKKHGGWYEGEPLQDFVEATEEEILGDRWKVHFYSVYAKVEGAVETLSRQRR